MQALKSPIIITSLRSRRDQSLGFSAETPTLTDEEFTAWRAFQGINAEMVISPLNETEDGTIEVEADLENKSQSQRLRAVMAIYFKKVGRPEEASKAYYRLMENLIDKYKGEIDKLPE